VNGFGLIADEDADMRAPGGGDAKIWGMRRRRGIRKLDVEHDSDMDAVQKVLEWLLECVLVSGWETKVLRREYVGSVNDEGGVGPECSTEILDDGPWRRRVQESWFSDEDEKNRMRIAIRVGEEEWPGDEEHEEQSTHCDERDDEMPCVPVNKRKTRVMFVVKQSSPLGMIRVLDGVIAGYGEGRWQVQRGRTRANSV
jgi:hypothetical protein